MKSTPKIRGYLAETKNLGVFLYRQSNKDTYLVSFDYQNKKDIVSIGSKFYGRIYPNRCDLSPDGKDFIYFAMGKSQKKYDNKLYCWSAICSPPIIKAHLLLSHGDTWGGGGHFIDENNIYISEGMHPDFKTDTDIDNESHFGKYKITFDPKYNNGRWDSKNNSWMILEKNDHGYATSWKKESEFLIIKKSVKENWLREGEYSMHNYVITSKNGEVILADEENINWADIDNYGRLLSGCGSKIKIYDSLNSIIERKHTGFDIEELVTVPQAVLPKAG